jgi:hypothetical protein
MTLIAGWVLIVMALFGFGLIVYGLIHQYGLRNLPQTPGTMVSCAPLLTHSNTTPADPGGSSTSSTMWTVDARYTFTANGKSYEGRRMSNVQPRNLVRKANPDGPVPDNILELCRRYAPGTAVSVYYDPSDPRYSFIFFTTPLKNWPWIIFPLMFGGVGWFFLHLAHKAAQTAMR